MTKLLLTLWGLCLATTSLAQPVGSWLVQGGMTHLSPHVGSSNLSPPSAANTQVDVGEDGQPTVQLTYIWDEHWALAMPLGTGFRHKLYGAGAINGTGQIGTVRALPVSVFGQYRFGETNAKVRPYLMLGLSYAHFHDAEGSAALNALNPINPTGGNTGLRVDSGWAWSPGLGVSVALDDAWFLDLSWARTYLKTTTSLSTGQTIDTRLNPDVTTVGIGLRF